MSNVGDTVKRLREEAGLSQSQLARVAKVSHAYIQRLEAGDYQRVSFEYAQKLATALGVSVQTLMGVEDIEEHRNGGLPNVYDLRKYAPNSSLKRLQRLLELFDHLPPEQQESVINVEQSLLPTYPRSLPEAGEGLRNGHLEGNEEGRKEG